MAIFKKNRKASRVTFCDGCGSVSDRTDRVERAVERNRFQAIVQGSVPAIR